MPNELLPARFDAMGSGDIPPDSFMVKHRLKRLPYNKTQKYKDSVKTGVISAVKYMLINVYYYVTAVVMYSVWKIRTTC